jgi:hypothetical protein
MVLELALRFVEGVADRDIHVLVGVMGGGVPTYHDLPPGNPQIDAHVEEFAVTMPVVGRLDHDPDARDAMKNVSAAAFSWTSASIAGEGDMFRKVIVIDGCMPPSSIRRAR